MGKYLLRTCVIVKINCSLSQSTIVSSFDIQHCVHVQHFIENLPCIIHVGYVCFTIQAIFVLQHRRIIKIEKFRSEIAESFMCFDEYN